MKRIILTESQYKRLVKQPLNEQEIIFGDGYSFSDMKNVNIINNLLVESFKMSFKKISKMNINEMLKFYEPFTKKLIIKFGS